MAVYILGGHVPDRSKGNYDPGAVANGYTEAELTRELRDLISAELTPRKVRHSIDHDADSLSQVLAKINSNESDVILDLHFNAASPQATGVEVIVVKPVPLITELEPLDPLAEPLDGPPAPPPPTVTV